MAFFRGEKKNLFFDFFDILCDLHIFNKFFILKSNILSFWIMSCNANFSTFNVLIQSGKIQYMMWQHVFTGAGGRRDKDDYLYHKVFTANLNAMHTNKRISVKRKQTTTTKHTTRTQTILLYIWWKHFGSAFILPLQFRGNLEAPFYWQHAHLISSNYPSTGQ